MRIRRLDSVVFETRDLAAMRAYYGDLLGLEINKFEKDGETRIDADDRYINFRVGDALIGFEKGEAAQLGTLVLKVESLREALRELRERGIKPTREHENWAIVADPEGRELILEQEIEPGSKT